MPYLEKNFCPHWDSPDQSCLMVRDGLFLPLDQHVAAYCHSNSYPSCYQYRLPTDAEKNEAGQEGAKPINRRRSIRIPCYYSFRFSEIAGHGLQEDDAWTIDLSDHGIRFASRKLLTRDMTIRFSLESKDTTAKFEGTGRVIWCAPLETIPLFHAAIVFADLPDPAPIPHHHCLR